MEHVEVVDRDYTEVAEAENDVRKKASPKVKLTEISKKAIDSVFAKARDRMSKSSVEVVKDKLDDTKSKIAESQKEMEKPKNFGSYLFNNIKISFLEKKVYKLVNKLERENRRALRVEQNMKNSIITKYLAAKENAKQMDVEQISRDDVAELINKAYEEKTVNSQPEIKNDVEVSADKTETPIVNEQNSDQVNENIETTSTIQRPRDRFVYEKDDEYNKYLQNFYAELFPEQVQKVDDTTYRLTKNEIIQDDLSVTPEFKAPAVIPEFQHVFDSIRVENEEVKNNNEEKKLSYDEIIEKINELLDNENATDEDYYEAKRLSDKLKEMDSTSQKELDDLEKEHSEKEKNKAATKQERMEKKKQLLDDVNTGAENKRRIDEAKQEKIEEIKKMDIEEQRELNMIKLLDEALESRIVNFVVKDEVSRGGK